MEPWDVPETEEGRQTLLQLIERYDAEEKPGELGWTLIAMARLCKQIGAPDPEQHPFVASAEYGLAAVEVFRKTEDKKGLAAALRAAAVPLVGGLDQQALLMEALAVSRLIGDGEGEGWAIYGLANQRLDPAFTKDQALQVFRSANSKVGMAVVLQSQAPFNDRGWELLCEAAELFAEAGHRKDAHRAYVMAVGIRGDERSVEECELVLYRALELADRPSDRATTYAQLSFVWKERDPEKSARYAAEVDALDVEIYGSRAGRLRHEIAHSKELLELVERKEKKDVREQIKRYEKELAELES